MRIRVLAVGDRMPGWVGHACEQYLRRLPRDFQVLIQAVRPGNRRTESPNEAMASEAARLLAKIEPTERVIALDVGGKSWSTEDLASRVESWRMDGRNICLLIGGPDGLHGDCLKRAEQHWSLSPLTLPHALVRVILLEQLYRVSSILSGHPYHR